MARRHKIDIINQVGILSNWNVTFASFYICIAELEIGREPVLRVLNSNIRFSREFDYCRIASRIAQEPGV